MNNNNNTTRATTQNETLKKLKPFLITIGVATFIFLCHLLEVYMPVTY